MVPPLVTRELVALPQKVVDAYQKPKREQEKEKNNEANMVNIFSDGDISPINISNLETLTSSKILMEGLIT